VSSVRGYAVGVFGRRFAEGRVSERGSSPLRRGGGCAAFYPEQYGMCLF